MAISETPLCNSINISAACQRLCTNLPPAHNSTFLLLLLLYWRVRRAKTASIPEHQRSNLELLFPSVQRCASSRNKIKHHDNNSCRTSQQVPTYYVASTPPPLPRLAPDQTSVLHALCEVHTFIPETTSVPSRPITILA